MKLDALSGLALQRAAPPNIPATTSCALPHPPLPQRDDVVVVEAGEDVRGVRREWHARLGAHQAIDRHRERGSEAGADLRAARDFEREKRAVRHAADEADGAAPEGGRGFVRQPHLDAIELEDERGRAGGARRRRASRATSRS